MLPSLINDFPLLLVALAAGLHIAGERRVVRMRRRPRPAAARWRAASFYLGLLVIVVALTGPIDSNASKLFWVHMIQHVLLLTVAAPLITLGAPWMSMWRPLPLGTRRDLARWVTRSRRATWLRAIGRGLGSPRGAWLAFNLNLVAWHIPGLYDLTVRHVSLHALEHTLFLGLGVLLWCQVVNSPPLHARLAPDRGAYFLVATGVVSWVLSLVLAFAPRPLYPLYAHIAERPGGISALADQQLAAGIMLGPGSVAITVFVFLGLYRWLAADGSGDSPTGSGPIARAGASIGGGVGG